MALTKFDWKDGETLQHLYDSQLWEGIEIEVNSKLIFQYLLAKTF
jgi:hypothetical protein